MVYVKEGSSAETFCKNKGIAYSLVTDDELDGLLNGSFPEIVQTSFMFDNTDPVVYQVIEATQPKLVYPVIKDTQANLVYRVKRETQCNPVKEVSTCL